MSCHHHVQGLTLDKAPEQETEIYLPTHLNSFFIKRNINPTQNTLYTTFFSGLFEISDFLI